MSPTGVEAQKRVPGEKGPRAISQARKHPFTVGDVKFCYKKVRLPWRQDRAGYWLVHRAYNIEKSSYSQGGEEAVAYSRGQKYPTHTRRGGLKPGSAVIQHKATMCRKDSPVAVLREGKRNKALTGGRQFPHQGEERPCRAKKTSNKTEKRSDWGFTFRRETEESLVDQPTP